MQDTMTHAAILQFHESIVSDLLARQLNAGDLIPRQLIWTQPDGGQQARLWWKSPVLRFGPDRTATLSIQLAGGLRLASQRILTVDGTLALRLTAEVHVIGERPLIALSPPPRGRMVDLSGVIDRLSYAGAQPPPAEVEADRELTAMRGALEAEFRRLLGTRPIYLPVCLFMRPQAFESKSAIDAGAELSLFASADAKTLTLALAAPPESDAHPWISTTRESLPECDVALAMTAEYANDRLLRMLPLPLRTSKGDVLADLTLAHMQFHEGGLRLTGRVSREADEGSVAAAATVDVDVRLSADAEGRLAVSVDGVRMDIDEDINQVAEAGTALLPGRVGHGAAAVRAARDTLLRGSSDVARDAWRAVIASALGGSYNPAHNWVDLSDCLRVPDADAPIVLTYCSVASEGVSLGFALSGNRAVFEPQPPDKLPVVELHTHVVPDVATDPERTRVAMQAQVVQGSYPEYDFAWRIGRDPALLVGHHESVLDVSQAGFATGDALEAMAFVQVRVVDAFGQVTRCIKPAWIQAALPVLTSKPHRSSGSGRRIMLAVTALLLVLASIALAANLMLTGHLTGGTGPVVATQPAILPTASPTATDQPSPTGTATPTRPTATTVSHGGGGAPLPSPTHRPAATVTLTATATPTVITTTTTP